MGRSGYSEDYEWDGEGPPPDFYQRAIDNALKGKRGQAFLRELAENMDAMPEKILIAEELVTADGECCAMGVVCKARRLDVSNVDYDSPEQVGKLLKIAPAMAREIAFYNDDEFNIRSSETPEQRWTRMRKWVAARLEAKGD